MKKNSKKSTNNTSADKKSRFSDFLPWIIILSVILVVLAIAGAVYFSDNYHHVKSFKFNNATGELYDKHAGITYVEAPMYFEPVRVSKKAYATDGYREYFQIGYTEEKDGKKTVKMLPTSEFLATAVDEGSFIYYNPKKVTIPSFEEFDPDISYVCDLNFNSLIEFDSNHTGILADALVNGERVMLEGCDEIFELRFRSSKYKYMSFCIDLYLIRDKFYYHDMYKKETVLLPSVAQKLIDKEKLSLFTDSKS
jgi:hypothetical protein